MSDSQRTPLEAAIHTSLGSEVYSRLNPAQKRQVEGTINALETRTTAAESSLLPGRLNPNSPEHYGMRHGSIRIDASTATAMNASSGIPEIGRESVARQLVGMPPLSPEQMGTLRGTLSSPVLHAQQRAHLNERSNEQPAPASFASLPLPESSTRLASANVDAPSSPHTPAKQPKTTPSPER
ncbi:MAG: hypothetical protein C0436_02880 [Alphaproteobacteria bacterium]|nr:hypothetical protein [Alphaproteobacteria bacterium]